MAETKKVVICGGGIMGCSTAYHLAKKGIPSIIVEQHDIACGASGKAGGFLAKDWCDHFEVGPLARASFALHMEFSEIFKDCDYRRVDTLEVQATSEGSGKPKKQKHLPGWVDGHIKSVDVMGSTDTTAQVHPRKLCRALLAAAQSLAAVEVRTAVVEGFERAGQRVTGVLVRPPDGPSAALAADAVVVTMGPWSGRALAWLGLPPAVDGRRAHGIVLRPPPGADVTAHALFSEVAVRGERPRSAEVYPRPDGTIYMCGMSDDRALPASAAAVAVDDGIAGRIRDLGGAVSSVIAGATEEARQACYMPMPADGLPLIGALPGAPGAFVAAGHSCWGILNGPATGRAMADLVADGACTWLDLRPFDPRRLLN